MWMWFPRLNWKSCPIRSYGGPACGVKIGRRRAAVTLAAATLAGIGLALALLGEPSFASDRPVKIVALGDSLTAGYGLPADQAFPIKLQAALAAKGIAAEIANAGVSGDTASGGLARLDQGELFGGSDRKPTCSAMSAILCYPSPVTAYPQSKAEAGQLVVEEDRVGFAVRQREAGNCLVIQSHLITLRLWEARGKQRTASQCLLLPCSFNRK